MTIESSSSISHRCTRCQECDDYEDHDFPMRTSSQDDMVVSRNSTAAVNPTISVSSKVCVTHIRDSTTWMGPTISARTHDFSNNISKWWATTFLTCQGVVSSTIALWVVPMFFVVFCTGCNFLKVLFLFLLPMGLSYDGKGDHETITETVIYTTSGHRTIHDPRDESDIPSFEGIVLVVLTIIIMMSIGSFCSWLERLFLDARTEHDLSPVVKTTFASEDVARYWVHYQKVLLRMMVDRIA